MLQQKEEQLINCKQSIAKLEALVSQIDGLKEQRAKDNEDVDLRKDQIDKYEKIIQVCMPNVFYYYFLIINFVSKKMHNWKKIKKPLQN